MTHEEKAAYIQRAQLTLAMEEASSATSKLARLLQRPAIIGDDMLAIGEVSILLSKASYRVQNFTSVGWQPNPAKPTNADEDEAKRQAEFVLEERKTNG